VLFQVCLHPVCFRPSHSTRCSPTLLFWSSSPPRSGSLSSLDPSLRVIPLFRWLCSCAAPPFLARSSPVPVLPALSPFGPLRSPPRGPYPASASLTLSIRPFQTGASQPLLHFLSLAPLSPTLPAALAADPQSSWLPPLSSLGAFSPGPRLRLSVPLFAPWAPLVGASLTRALLLLVNSLSPRLFPGSPG